MITNVVTPTTVAVTLEQILFPRGNCFQLASQYLGDATQVDRLMALNPQLNGDPWFDTPQTITFPPVSPGAGSGGIWTGPSQ
jgi:hypothetical protein